MPEPRPGGVVALKAGWLEKKGGNWHTFKRRWFVLQRQVIEYFTDPTLKKKCGAIPIVDCRVTKEDGGGREPGFYFCIRVPVGLGKRTDFLCRAAAESERAGWMGAIQDTTTVTVVEAPLSNACRVNRARPGVPLAVPAFLVKAVRCVDGRLGTEGIYRVNGPAAQVQNVLAQLNKNEDIEFTDVHVATAVLKTFLRKLHEPLLTYAAAVMLKGIHELEADARPELLARAVRGLPIANFCTLAFVFAHLRRVLAREPENRMNVQAVAVCMGPCLIRHQFDDPSEAVAESKMQLEVAALLLVHYERLFGAYPLLQMESRGVTWFAEVIVEQDAEAPFALRAPVEAVVQVIAEDAYDWVLAVYDDSIGAIHKSCLQEVAMCERTLEGLARQRQKWTLPPGIQEELREACPESVILYSTLRETLDALRSRVGARS